MPRILAAVLLVAVLAIGGGLIATTAYQAGIATAVTATGSTGAATTPIVLPAYGYGYGWHPGFGFFGFLGTLLFLFVVFALVRAIFWRGGPGRRGGWGQGWGGSGYGDGNGGPGRGNRPWESQANQAFEEWHRRAHGEAAPPVQGDPTEPTGTA
jgi:hypothetical protein